MKNFPNIMMAALALALLSCRNQGGNEVREPLPEEYRSFVEFYERFHQDSAYQMEHIVFPLEGLPSEADSATIASGAFRWTQDNWRLQRGFDLESSGFAQELIPVGEGLIIEKITHKAGGLGMQRRFARLGQEWYLIYYAGLNRVKQEGNISIEGGF